MILDQLPRLRRGLGHAHGSSDELPRLGIGRGGASGLPVTYSSTTGTICTVNASSGALTLLAVGNWVIAANEAGNANYNAAAQVTQTFAVGKASRLTAFWWWP